MNDKHPKFNNKKSLKNKKKDPFAKREAEKYQNPIPSREFILSVIKDLNVPVNFNRLKKEIAINGSEQEFALRKRLRAMVRDGQIDQINKNYCLKNFISQYNKLKFAERVITQQSQVKKIVGKMFKLNGFNYVAPFLNKDLQQDIVIPLGDEHGAEAGNSVIVEVIMPVFKWADPIGKVIKILGDADDRSVLINSAIISLNIPHIWANDIKQQLLELNKEIPDNVAESRLDLTKLPFVTIDGEDAKDFDDAVFCEVNKTGGWNLYVMIADVSYYVKQGGLIDNEALLRGNSVYFPSKVIPMLPELFSNDLCSLKPNVDRLGILCKMHISKTGKLTKYEFKEAIMCSKARLTYNKVAEILNNTQKTANLEQSILDNLLELYNVFKMLQQQRKERGAIEFETPESKMIFNKKGDVTEIKVVRRNIAHKIIEECMLCANVATAKFLEKNKLLSIYRVHEGPTSVKLTDLVSFLKGVGLSLDSANNPTPKDYSNLLQNITNRKDADVIQMILLRSMCQAVYSTDNIGHFGLAYPAYTHFTSPIRRYTDLLVHRHIKAIMHNTVDQLQSSGLKLQEIAEHCSLTERRADDATREVIRVCKCKFLVKYIGHKFKGIITGVTKFGLFVEIKDLYVDGLVHINSLKQDYFIHDPVHHKLVGEKTGIIYSLGMELEVIVAKVDLDRRRIDLALSVEHKKSKSKNSKEHKAKAKSKVKAKTKSKTKSKVKGNAKSNFIVKSKVQNNEKTK